MKEQAKKSFSFYFNASAWLSSQSVRLMSKAERGVYIHLLATAWGSKQPGTLPASEDQVRRLAECTVAEWAEMGPAILEVFPLSECQTYRYNERLMVEVEKERVKSERAAKSAAARWKCDDDANASEKHANASEKHAIASAKQCGNDAQEQEQEQEQVKKNERTAGARANSASLLASGPVAEKEGGRPAAKPREFLADEAPTFLSANFSKFVDKANYGHVDKAHYLLRIQRKAEKLLARTDEGWENYILEWLDRDKRGGQLVLPVVAGAAHALPVDNSRFGPAARPATTGYSIAAKLEEQKNNLYL